MNQQSDRTDSTTIIASTRSLSLISPASTCFSITAHMARFRMSVVLGMSDIGRSRSEQLLPIASQRSKSGTLSLESSAPIKSSRVRSACSRTSSGDRAEPWTSSTSTLAAVSISRVWMEIASAIQFI